jgi:nitrogen regulatory protein PII
MDLATVNIDGSSRRHSLPMDFYAVVIIVPNDKKVDAIQAASKAGASGVTVLKADGMGLGKMQNFYRASFEANDSLLLFLLPKTRVNPVIKSTIHSLHITTEGKGIAFAFPLTHMKGISLSRHDIFQNRKDHDHNEEIDLTKEEKVEEKVKNEDNK